MAVRDALPLRGPSRGVFQWYYHTAAEVRDYAVTWDKGARTFTVRGGVVNANVFMLQRPDHLTFAVLRKGAPAVCWPVIGAIRITDGRVVARLGSPGQELSV